MRSPSKLLLATLLLAACKEAPTTVLLTVQADPRVVLDEVRLSVFDSLSSPVRDLRLPAAGPPQLPDTVVLYSPRPNGRIRILARARQAGARTGEGVTIVDLLPGGQATAFVEILPSALPDRDHDGVPDAIDNCADIANPDQGPCTSTDAGPPDGAPVDRPAADGAKPDLAPGDVAKPDKLQPDHGPSSCTMNGIKDGNETDIDCGGGCPACGPGKACSIHSDCTGGCFSKICDVPLAFPDNGNVLSPDIYVEATINPTNASIIYAENFAGQVLKSTDGGSSWAPQCQVPNTGLQGSWSGWTLAQSSRIQVSPAADGTAYVSTSSAAYRVDALAGGPCPLITSTLNNVSGNGAAGSIAISPSSGNLYAWQQSSTGKLWRSKDHGASWSTISTSNVTCSSSAWIVVDPADEMRLLIQCQNSSSGGLYLTTDGTSFTKVAAGIYGAYVQVRFDPRKNGYLYANAGSATSGFVSSNGGQTFLQSTAHAMTFDWALDQIGAGYRLVVGAGQTTLQRAPDMRTPIWSPLPAGVFSSQDAYARVDAVGQTIVAVVGLRLYLSKNGGQSFQAAGGGQPVISGFSSVDSVDGQTIYATALDWSIWRSLDGGKTYALKHAPASAGGSGKARIHVNRANPQNVLVYAYTDRETSTYDNSLIVSHDGLTSAVSSKNGLSSWGNISAFSITVPGIVYYLGDNLGSRVSVDAGDTSTTMSPAPYFGGGLWTPGAAEVKPSNSNIAWLTCSFASGSASFFEYNHTTKAVTDLTAKLGAALGNDSPTGMELYQIGGVNRLRVISAKGWIGYSDDEAQTFAPLAGAVGGLSSCVGWAQAQRQISSLASNRNLIASWCPDADVAFSKDAGKTWTKLGNNFGSYGCNVKSVVVTPSNLVIACKQRPLLLLPY